jgi:lipopolysaccharide/colanic/teichoic acid biosynthesis glycosyltransferase
VVPAYQRYRHVKRAVDLFLCLIAAPIVLPVLAICALAVRLESAGPVLFSQRRVGQHGRDFRIYKFRTMVKDAEALKAKYAHLNILPPPDFKIINDPRVTRVGRFLRKSSLDELPQLLNVVRGEMSLVGPRPTDFDISQYDLWHTERLEVPPGLTGLWQISARHTVDFDKRLRLDIEYIDRMSLRTDLSILFRTVSVVMRGSGE